MTTGVDVGTTGEHGGSGAAAGRVLVIDDEPTMVELLGTALRYEGWQVETAPNGRTAQCVAYGFQPDAVVLDLLLPDSGGMDVIRRLREMQPALPALLLTAADSVEAWLSCVDGDSDYLTKPFSVEELVCRLRRIMPPVADFASGTDTTLVVGDLSLDEASREVRRAGDLIRLNDTAFDVLCYLMRNAQKALSSEQILHAVWNYDFGGQSNVVDLYISYLRRKIDDVRAPMIHMTCDACYLLKPAE
jgi:two-component system, OmpR family, response regulator